MNIIFGKRYTYYFYTLTFAMYLLFVVNKKYNIFLYAFIYFFIYHVHACVCDTYLSVRHT